MGPLESCGPRDSGPAAPPSREAWWKICNHIFELLSRKHEVN